MPEKVAFICVNIVSNEGTFFASSPDLPGLFLCGKSLQDVKDDVGPMIEKFYLLTQKLRVKVERAVDAKSFDTPAANGDRMRFWAAPLEALAA